MRRRGGNGGEEYNNNNQGKREENENKNKVMKNYDTTWDAIRAGQHVRGTESGQIKGV
jgi:ubiquinone/menaquinone biosynthesis C-methylase UbiE